jgi:hypothetical protein
MWRLGGICRFDASMHITHHCAIENRASRFNVGAAAAVSQICWMAVWSASVTENSLADARPAKKQAKPNATM